jgi:hypothetical protein
MVAPSIISDNLKMCCSITGAKRSLPKSGTLKVRLNLEWCFTWAVTSLTLKYYNRLERLEPTIEWKGASLWQATALLSNIRLGWKGWSLPLSPALKRYFTWAVTSLTLKYYIRLKPILEWSP